VADRIDHTRLGRQVAQTAGRAGGLIEKIVLGLVVCTGMSIGTTVLASGGVDLAVLVFSVCATFVGSVLLGHWLCVERFKQHGDWTPRLVVAAIIAVTLAALRAIMVSAGLLNGIGGGWFVPVLLAALVCDWRSRLDSGRRGEVSAGEAFSAGLFGLVCAAIVTDGVALPVAAMLAAASLCIQTVSGIWPIKASAADEDVTRTGAAGLSPQMPGGPVVVSRDGMPTVPAGGAGHCAQATATPVDPRLLRGSGVRAIWAVVAALLLLGMILAFASAGVVDWNDDEFAIAIMTGTLLAHAFLFALWCAAARYKKGLWRGVFRKAVFLGGLALSACSGEAMGLLTGPGEAEFLFALAGILVGGLMAIAVWFIPAPAYQPPRDKKTKAPKSEAEKRQELAWSLRLGAGSLVIVGVGLVPVLLATVPEHDWEELLPAVLVPIAATCVGLFVGSVWLSVKKAGKPDKVDLPLRRNFVVDSLDAVDELLMRHTALHGYRLKHRGDLLWVFQRGDWAAQFWQSDIRRWKTELRIAAYTHAHEGHRLSCQLDLERTFQQPAQAKLQSLTAEMDELRDLLGGRDTAPSGREVSV